MSTWNTGDTADGDTMSPWTITANNIEGGSLASWENYFDEDEQINEFYPS